MKTINVRLTDTDKDIIAHLESKGNGNASNYIRELIRKDMFKGPTTSAKILDKLDIIIGMLKR